MDVCIHYQDQVALRPLYCGSAAVTVMSSLVRPFWTQFYEYWIAGLRLLLLLRIRPPWCRKFGHNAAANRNAMPGVLFYVSLSLAQLHVL
jgi:hypothetical protein